MKSWGGARAIRCSLPCLQRKPALTQLPPLPTDIYMNSLLLYCNVLGRLSREQYLKTTFGRAVHFRIGRLRIVFRIVLWITGLQLPIICATQEPTTRSEQLLCSRVTAFLLTSFFRTTLGRILNTVYLISPKKPDRKTHKPENGPLRKLWNGVNCFPVSHKVDVIHIHGITQNEEWMD